MRSGVDMNDGILDAHREMSQSFARMHKTGPGHQVELPSVPRTGEDLTLATPIERPVGRRQGGAIDPPATDGNTFVRTKVKNGDYAAIQVEHPDGELSGAHDAPRTRRQVG